MKNIKRKDMVFLLLLVVNIMLQIIAVLIG